MAIPTLHFFIVVGRARNRDQILDQKSKKLLVSASVLPVPLSPIPPSGSDPNRGSPKRYGTLEGGCAPDLMGFHHALASNKARKTHALMEMAC